ncbi:MAG: S16 family serine protease [Actinomycetota bacterium]|nr:S16 family serine protease [Actinomycetota bacterium]
MTFEHLGAPSEPAIEPATDPAAAGSASVASLVRRPSSRHRWWAVPLAGLGMITAAVPLAVSFVPSTAFVEKSRCEQYDTSVDPPTCTSRVAEAVEYALVPADAEPVAPRLSIEGAPTYDSQGQIYFVTITEPKISLLDWFITRNNDAARLLSRYDKFGDQTPQQLTQSGQQQMRSAKDNAMYVALKAAGYPVELQQGDVIIDFLLCLEANAAGTECVQFSPADEVLDPGDQLTSVDGTPVTTVDDLGPILAKVKAGDMIDVEFVRNGEEMTGEIETILAPGEDPPRTIIGFRPIDTTTVKLPEGIEVEINTDLIGGPSAGLAFTLTLIDQLTEGDLMGGHRVAVTGTINLDGDVGAIGGLNAKASAVQQVGVRYFLVPAGQGMDGSDGVLQARKVVGDDVEIIMVATVQEALDALERIGGDPVQLVDLPTV